MKKTKILTILCALLLLAVLLNVKWISGLFLLLFLPGFMLTLVLFRDMPVDERIGYAVILSISVNILAVFAANYFAGFEITTINVASLILVISLLFLLVFLIFSYFRIHELMKIKDSIKNFKLKKDDVLKSLLLVLTLFLVFNLVYAVHGDYPYPYHTDEWENLAESVAIMENHALLKEAPNCKGIMKKMDLEIGAHLFLAEFFLLTGADPASAYKYLPALFAVISGFMLFLIVKRYNFYAAILAILFFASLKTNISILGIWIFAPLTMSIALIYGITFMFLNAIENRLSFFLAAAISLLALAMIHPISAVFVYMFISAYILLKFVYYLLCLIKNLLLKTGKPDTMFTKKNILGFAVLFLIPFISFIYFLAILSKGSLSSTVNWFITKFIIFPKAASISSLIYNPSYIPDLYGSLGIGLAVIGILYIFYVQRIRSPWKHPDLLVVAALTGVINLIMFHFPNAGAFLLNGVAVLFKISGMNLVFNLPAYFTLFIFYERLIYYTMIFMAPLSAIGLYAVLAGIFNVRILDRVHRHSGIFLCLILTIAVFTQVYWDYYEEKDKLYKMITGDDYNAIKWLEENEGKGHVILARTEVSMAIYSISQNYVVAGTSHEDNCPGQNVKDVHGFFMGDCKTRLEILKKHNVDYLISDFQIPCNLTEIHRSGKDYVYEVSMP